MPNYGYHLARAKGRVARAAYRFVYTRLKQKQPVVAREFPLEVFSYSGEAALLEQIASVRSFLQFAGRPPRFTIVSDGSYSVASIRLLEQLDPSITVQPIAEWIPPGLPPALYPYLRDHPTGRQLAIIMSLPKNEPVVYTDSDVLFFAGATDLAERIRVNAAPALYLADCQFSGDERLMRPDDPRLPPVNTGFLMLCQPLDWSLSIKRFLALNALPNFFTNQTMTHLTMHANRASPFDASKYVLQLDDQFVFADRYASDAIAMRHYVNPVRHKFWATLSSR